jgi:hypothetical protein
MDDIRERIIFTTMVVSFLVLIFGVGYIFGANDVKNTCSKYGSYKLDKFEMDCQVKE